MTQLRHDVKVEMFQTNSSKEPIPETESDILSLNNNFFRPKSFILNRL